MILTSKGQLSRSIRKVAFLDRDGVINRDYGYVYREEDFEFLPGVFEALRQLNAMGYEIIIVTNQSGIARGYYTKQDFLNLTSWMLDKLQRAGVQVLDVYFCPHFPKGVVPEFSHLCDCRKPAPGMLLRAANEHGIDVKSSIMIGDKYTDIEAGMAAGVGRNYLIVPQCGMDTKNYEDINIAAGLSDCVCQEIALTITNSRRTPH